MSSATRIALMGALIGSHAASDGHAVSELPGWAQVVYLSLMAACLVLLVACVVTVWRWR